MYQYDFVFDALELYGCFSVEITYVNEQFGTVRVQFLYEQRINLMFVVKRSQTIFACVRNVREQTIHRAFQIPFSGQISFIMEELS